MLAREFARKNQNLTVVVVADPSRVIFENSEAQHIISVNRFIVGLTFFLSLLSRNVEVIVPHGGFGRVIGLISRFARNFSLVDDGMDSFRDSPRNLSDLVIRRAKNYYTFSYSFGMAEWTSVLNKIEVCGSISLSEDAKSGYLVAPHEVLVVESPGLKFQKLQVGHMLLFAHPSRFKSMTVDSEIKAVSGLKYSLEKTLISFKGPVHIGETLALIFLLEHRTSLDNVHVHLTSELYDNLSCLHSQIAKCCLTLS